MTREFDLEADELVGDEGFVRAGATVSGRGVEGRVVLPCAADVVSAHNLSFKERLVKATGYPLLRS